MSEKSEALTKEISALLDKYGAKFASEYDEPDTMGHGGGESLFFLIEGERFDLENILGEPEDGRGSYDWNQYYQSLK